MKYNNIEITQMGGIKCDNEKCDWEDMTIPVEEYQTWVTKGCPKCGEVVLTQEDVDNHNKMISMIDIINSIEPSVLQKMYSQMTTDEIIDRYEVLKSNGITQIDEENWEIDGFKMRKENNG